MGTGTEVDKVSKTNFTDEKMTITETLSLNKNAYSTRARMPAFHR
jgi:hypothetical protein